jgi:uncharacterized protein (TIRG00374 family)
MDEEQKPRSSQTYSRLTIISVFLLVAVGAVIVLLDRKQVVHLLDTSNWSYLVGALILTSVSYVAGSASFVVIMRVFGNRIKTSHLLNIGMASMVLQNLIGQPAGLSLRILLLGRQRVRNHETVAASLLLSYFKNLLYFSLIPISLIYIVFSHPLPAFGVTTVLLIIIILIALLLVATGIAFNARLRVFVLHGIARIWQVVSRRNIQNTLEQFSEAVTLGVEDLKKRRKNRIPLAISIAVDVATSIAVLWFCFAALGIPVSLGVLLTGFNFGITLTVISFIPGDMGVQEATMAGVFALFGVPFSQGVIAAVLFRVVYYFVPFVISLAFYWSLLREKVAEEPAL